MSTAISRSTSRISADDFTIGDHSATVNTLSQGETNKHLHALCLARLAEAEEARSEQDADVTQNLLFCAGKQYITLLDANGGFIVEEPVADRVRAVVNFLRPLVTKRISRLVRNRAELKRAPDDAGDPEDEVIARGDDQYWRHIERQQRIPSKYAAVMSWAVKAGYGIFKTFWDPSIGPLALEPELDDEGNIVWDEKCEACNGTGFDQTAVADTYAAGLEGGAIPGTEALGTPPCPLCAGVGGVPMMLPTREGDVHIKVPSWFDFFPDPSASCISGDDADAEFVIEREWLSVPQFKDAFPRYKSYVGKEDSSTSVSTSFTLASLFAADAGSLFSAARLRGRIEVFTLYARPNSRNRRGKIYRFTRRFFIEKFDFPETHIPGAWHPFTLFFDFKTDGTLQASSVVTDLRNLQQLYNKLFSLGIEGAELAVQPPVGMDSTAVVSADDDYPRPGKQFLFDARVPGGKPDFMRVPGLPPEVFKLLELLFTMAREACVIGDDTPEGRSSGRIIALMNEVNDNTNSVILEDQKAAMIEVCERALAVVKEHITSERRINVIGRAGQSTAAVLRPFTDPTQAVNVVTVAGRLLPDSPIARFEVLAQIGQWLVDPETGTPDYQLALELLDVGSDRIDRTRKQREAAVVENQWMRENGQPHPISPEDNHQVHILAHLDEAWMMPAGDELRTATYEPHITKHRQFWQQAKNAAIMANQAQITTGQTPTSGDIPGQTTSVGSPDTPQAQMAAIGTATAGMPGSGQPAAPQPRGAGAPAP